MMNPDLKLDWRAPLLSKNNMKIAFEHKQNVVPGPEFKPIESFESLSNEWIYMVFSCSVVFQGIEIAPIKFYEEQIHRRTLPQLHDFRNQAPLKRLYHISISLDTRRLTHIGLGGQLRQLLSQDRPHRICTPVHAHYYSSHRQYMFCASLSSISLRSQRGL